MEREGGKKKKKRKMSSPSPSEDGESQSMSDTEDNVQKKKAAKKKKKVKMPKGPKRWDEVNVEADKRYFDVSDNIESGSGNVVSLSDQEPAPSNQVQDGANPALADYSRLDLLDPIT